MFDLDNMVDFFTVMAKENNWTLNYTVSKFDTMLCALDHMILTNEQLNQCETQKDIDEMVSTTIHSLFVNKI